MFGFHYLSLNICLPVVLGKAKSPLWGQTPALGAARRGHSREGSPLPSFFLGLAGGRGSGERPLCAAGSKKPRPPPGSWAENAFAAQLRCGERTGAGCPRPCPAVPGRARAGGAPRGRAVPPRVAPRSCHRCALATPCWHRGERCREQGKVPALPPAPKPGLRGCCRGSQPAGLVPGAARSGPECMLCPMVLLDPSKGRPPVSRPQLENSSSRESFFGKQVF